MRRSPSACALRDEELRLYLGILAAASAIVAIELWYGRVRRGRGRDPRTASFQVVSIMTTTGFATVDFVVWPTLALMTLVALMFVGGSAGSTARLDQGRSPSPARAVLRRELHQTLHPELVHAGPATTASRSTSARSGRSIAFMLLYVGMLRDRRRDHRGRRCVQGPPLRALEAIAASATTLGNVGPGFGVTGPMGSFEPFSDVSTVVMTALMWLGRLEVIPIVVLLTRGYWRA